MRSLSCPVFLLIIGAALLTAAACDRPGPASASGHASRVATASFNIGSPDAYRSEGVYSGLAKSHGVYLVSGHGMLVALAATCTNDGHRPVAVRFDDVAGVFRCPLCDAKFTRDGLNRGKSRATRALERCRLRSAGKLYDRDNTVVVDPDKRYRQEAQQWSRGGSYVSLREALSSDRP